MFDFRWITISFERVGEFYKTSIIRHRYHQWCLPLFIHQLYQQFPRQFRTTSPSLVPSSSPSVLTSSFPSSIINSIYCTIFSSVEFAISYTNGFHVIINHGDRTELKSTNMGEIDGALESRTCILNFLTQRSVQLFMFLQKECRGTLAFFL